MTLSDLRLGPQDRVTLVWNGKVWSASYHRMHSNTRYPQYHFKQGIPGESAEEVARGAIQAAQLSQVK